MPIQHRSIQCLSHTKHISAIPVHFSAVQRQCNPRQFPCASNLRVSKALLVLANPFQRFAFLFLRRSRQCFSDARLLIAAPSLCYANLGSSFSQRFQALQFLRCAWLFLCFAMLHNSSAAPSVLFLCPADLFTSSARLFWACPCHYSSMIFASKRPMPELRHCPKPRARP